MTSHSTGNSGLRLLSSLAKFCSFLFKGKVPTSICPIFFGASLCALNKKGGGIRPIAVGNTLRRLAAKVASFHVRADLGPRLQPVQLGFGTSGGAEAAAHSARRYVSFDHPDKKVFLKIDFFNAFNTVNRDCILRAASSFMPALSPFLSQCYREPSFLFFGPNRILSQRGIQQGDPLGPALFCSVIQPMVASLSAELNLWYLDDGALGGSPETVAQDLKTIDHMAKDLGLALNFKKCELFGLGFSEQEFQPTQEVFSAIAPGIRFPKDRDCCLLDAPLKLEAIEEAVSNKTENLKRMSSRLSTLSTHSAFFILKNSLSIPKLSYVLRCSPTWLKNDCLVDFDNSLKDALEGVINTQLTQDAWIQSALPISKGGLGIRHATDLALPAFMASTSSVAPLVCSTLPHTISVTEDPHVKEGSARWLTAFPSLPLPTSNSQRDWESPFLESSREGLLVRATTLQEKARLLGVSAGESGAFLNAIPSPSLGTFLDDNTFRIAIALRLGMSICQPHVCVCGSEVNRLGTHGLSCKKSAGRLSRHSAVNDIIKRGLISAGFPVTLEPSFLSFADNKRPDGVTQIPWSGGKSLVWDFTCSDSLAPSYLASSSCEPLYAATTAETLKKRKYAHLATTYIFSPIAAECLGAFGKESAKLISQIGKKISAATGEKRASEYFVQRISASIQRGNAASIMATITKESSLEEVFYLL